MNSATQQQLLQLNRAFYATVAPAFDQTRGGLPIGWQQLHRWLPTVEGRPLRLLDVGCGNGRLAWLLDEWQRAEAGRALQPVDYVGIDADLKLLALATDHALSLQGVRARFIEADFTAPDWPALCGLVPDFDVVVCFAALHHVPGHQLRGQVMQTLATLVAPGGLLIVSHWQFLTSSRFVRKQIAWQTIGLTEDDVEPGDALLPWNQGPYAVRYVHQVDPTEATALATAAQLHIVDHYYADGKEGNLNLYTLLKAYGVADQRAIPADGDDHEYS